MLAAVFERKFDADEKALLVVQPFECFVIDMFEKQENKLFVLLRGGRDPWSG